MNEDFDYSALEEIGDSVLDFENVYETGKFIKQYLKSELESEEVEGTFIVREGEILSGFSNEKFEPKIEKLKDIFKVILKVLSPKVKPVFVELSIFDPDDPLSDSFYTVLFGKSEIIEGYLKQMERNIHEEKSNLEKRGNRGALLPSLALYQSAHYAKRYRNKILSEKLDYNKMSIYMGSYSLISEDVSKTNHLTIQNLRNQVEKFFDDVMFETIKVENKKNKKSLALLVPIARPIGTSQKEAIKKLRGGGLFVFGSWDESSYSPGRAALRILNILHRAVMHVSQARIETVASLDALHEHAYDTQGHELRKLIRWITNRTPEPVLTNLQMYFNSLFAISEADVDKIHQSQMDWGYPKEYAAGETLKEFISNALRVALRVEKMIAWCSSHNSRQNVGKSDQEIETEIENSVNGSLWYLSFEKKSRNLFHELIEGGFKQRWFFFGALVSAFRNISQHQKPNSEIKVSFNRTENTLTICNKGQGDYDAVTDKVSREKEKSWRGSTGSTLKFFVIKYNADPKKVELKWRDSSEEDLTFLTVIPLPDAFL